ncbi:hypothetical protein [Streptomyces sp. 3214.6]|uniref:hypothetical protein n=1 Tax=Streptomyces sp. 3214.6 TaxID=1882757 RepID=UPI00090B84AD|nr:hypothetical protein [Streptomyces sp. 3214.6]SHI68578.1 hypothetical protein SAMN05444521_8234 [Streptomyces sp. 3214.6]
MTISYVAAGALSQATVTITPAYPAGATAGRLAILQVVSGHPNDSIPSTPSGWTLVETFSGGGGSFGSGTGPRRLTWFARVLIGSDAAPTTTLPTGTGELLAGRIHVLSRSAGTGWRWASSSGEDTSSGTGFSVVGATALTWTTGDFALIGYALPVSTAALSAEAITATGITFGTVTERADDQITSGNAGRLGAATGSVTAGTGAQAPTLAATASTATTGVAGVLRVREASAALTATAQNVFPPRVLTSVTGMLAEDIVSATVYRVLGTDRTAVRAASAVDVTGTDALLRVDAEQPFGVAVSYLAELTDINGLTWTVTSGSITSTVTADVISDAVQALGAAVKLETPLEKQRTRDATVFNVGGRYVVVGRRRSKAQATITVRTETDADGDALEAVLDGATEGVVHVRKQTTLSRLDGYFAITEDTEAPTWYDGYRWWTLTAIEVEAWPDSLEARGFTLQDIADNYTSLQDIADDNATLLILAQRSF